MGNFQCQNVINTFALCCLSKIVFTDMPLTRNKQHTAKQGIMMGGASAIQFH